MGCVRVSFKEVDQKIRLHQNLIIETVDAGISMMMTELKADALYHVFFKSQLGEHLLCQGRTFFFLQFSVSVSVFFQTQPDADIVHNGGSFRNEQCFSSRCSETAIVFAKLCTFRKC